MGICLKREKCVPNSSLREFLVREAHSGSLMGHFGVKKTLDTLHEHFFLQKMRRYVERICSRCITYRKAKSRVLPHGLYTLGRYFYGLVPIGFSTKIESLPLFDLGKPETSP